MFAITTSWVMEEKQHGDMTDHNCEKINLLPLVHQVYEALIHCICKVAALTPWDDILYNEPEEQLV